VRDAGGGRAVEGGRAARARHARLIGQESEDQRVADAAGAGDAGDAGGAARPGGARVAAVPRLWGGRARCR